MDYRRRFGHSHARGGDAMYLTLSDLIQLGLLVVAIIALCKKSNR